MIAQIKELFRKNGLIISIYFILLIIVGNLLFTFYYWDLLVDNSKIKEQVLSANHGIEFMNKYVNLADLGLRGYIIDQNEKFLSPYNEAISSYLGNFDLLREVMGKQGFDISKIDPAEKAVDQYMKLVQQMVKMCSLGDVDEAIRILKKDPGYDAWKNYSVFEREAIEFENTLSQEANARYDAVISQMLVAQILLFLLGGPILFLAAVTIQKGNKIRFSLFKNLFESNKKYIFNSGADQEKDSEEGVIDLLISNLKKITVFISNIASGNYAVSWEGLSTENEELNKENIAGELIAMRDQMKKVKDEDEIRIWITQGLSNFAEIVRTNQQNFKLLSERLIVNLVKYLNAQQGGLFILNEDNVNDVYLELMGCYAYDRIKVLTKRIELGQGLVGQCYLEKESIYMTNIPQDFVNITSGLGDARPNCILIVPLKLNDRIEGVIELASLRPFKAHEIEFVEKLAETIASAITSVRTAENTKLLLERSQQQTEEMRAQEEEMRQNMEELQATQEQMERKNEEVETLLSKASQNEQILEKQKETILLEKKNLETENSILTTLMEVIPDRITVKDREGKYLKVSKSKFKTLEEQGFKDVIGKSDKEMFGKEHFEKSFSVEKEIMVTRKPVLNVEERIEISKGIKIWGMTSRVPLKDTEGNILGTLVVTRDITREKVYEEEIEALKTKE